MTQTIIIRDAPTAGRLRRSSLVVPAPAFHLRAAPVRDALHAARIHLPLVVWWTLGGALLWPATIVWLMAIAPLPATLMIGPRPSDTLVMSWYVGAALGAGSLVGRSATPQPLET